jgi:CheY-like chemotaxis protein/nitrogen-specific signal transduction histidine kinase
VIVLIVDDEAMNRKLLRAILEAANYTVLEAGDGVEALALLEEKGADAIISDILMPRMDGYRLCNEIRSRERFRNLPLIFYSSTYISATDEERSLEVGADLYLKKPISSAEILKALRDLTTTPRTPRKPVVKWDDQVVLKEYNQALVNKLEDKCAELEAARVQLTAMNAELQRSVRLEEQFRQSQKMEAIGVLAGGVAHDFNNLLTVINGYSSFLLEHPPEPDKAKDMLRQIGQAGKRAAALTRQLLAFSHTRVLQLSVLDLNDLLANMETMLTRLIEANIKLLVVPSPKHCRVKADYHQIEQVIMNLVVNSRDAMPNGGTIVIETRHVQLTQPLIHDYGVVPPGRYVLLSVRDTGKGMNAETARRVFEPFFTTKEMGKGTGLGLSTVYGIGKQSGGHIRFTSELGFGTTFNIYLPSVEDEPPPAPAQTGGDDLPRGAETILLVDDEEAIRELSRIIIETAGYTVLEAQDGRAALELVSRQPHIDLLVTDVVMPRMGGGDLVQALRSLCPTMRVLYLSGYAADGMVRHGVSQEKAAFLHKPFTAPELTRKIREALDAKESPGQRPLPNPE